MARAATTSPARRTRAAGGPCPAGLPCLSSRAVGSARAVSRLCLAARRQGRQDGAEHQGVPRDSCRQGESGPAVRLRSPPGWALVNPLWHGRRDQVGSRAIRIRPGPRTGGPRLPVTERCGLQRERWSDASARGAARPTPGEGHLRLRSGVPAHQGRSPARGHLSCLLLRRRASCRRAPPWARFPFLPRCGTMSDPSGDPERATGPRDAPPGSPAGARAGTITRFPVGAADFDLEREIAGIRSLGPPRAPAATDPGRWPEVDGRSEARGQPGRPSRAEAPPARTGTRYSRFREMILHDPDSVPYHHTAAGHRPLPASGGTSFQ